jgi:hypothetical protein
MRFGYGGTRGSRGRVYLRSSKRRQTRRRDVLRRLQAQDQLLRPGHQLQAGAQTARLGRCGCGFDPYRRRQYYSSP